MYRENLQVVSKSELVRRLEESLTFMSSGGTDYRIETAKISLKVSVELEDFSIFNDRKNVKVYITKVLPMLDEERCTDVSENLYHHYRDLYLKKNLSDEIQAEIMRRKKKRNKVTFSPT